MRHFSNIFELFDGIVNMVASFEDKSVYENIKFCEIINADKKVLEQIIADQDVDYLQKLRTNVIQKHKNVEDKYEYFMNMLNAYITAKVTDAQKPKPITLTEEELNKIIAEAVEKATANK